MLRKICFHVVDKRACWSEGDVNSLKWLCKFRNLEEVVFINPVFIDAITAKRLVKFTKLKRLTIKSCQTITEEAMKIFSSLQYLKIEDSVTLYDKFHYLSVKNSNIETLEYTANTFIFFHAAKFPRLKKLKELVISLKLYPDMEDLINTLPSLEKLTLQVNPGYSVSRAIDIVSKSKSLIVLVIMDIAPHYSNHCWESSIQEFNKKQKMKRDVLKDILLNVLPKFPEVLIDVISKMTIQNRQPIIKCE